jgi:hypothetical protein
MSPWGWTGIKGLKHVGHCYTINVIKLYICQTINIVIKMYTAYHFHLKCLQIISIQQSNKEAALKSHKSAHLTRPLQVDKDT